ADWLEAVRAEAGDRIFINARVDSFLLGRTDPAEAITRCRLYLAAGADCVYPLGAPPEHLPLLRKETGALINMAPWPPGGPSIPELGRLGASRITFGPFLQHQAATAVRKMAEKLRTEGFPG
ncbi:isocitrate lyase/phosphoenolpyruvate mutase family protein, partial [Streptomyces sp. NPDC055078]